MVIWPADRRSSRSGARLQKKAKDPDTRPMTAVGPGPARAGPLWAVSDVPDSPARRRETGCCLSAASSPSVGFVAPIRSSSSSRVSRVRACALCRAHARHRRREAISRSFLTTPQSPYPHVNSVDVIVIALQSRPRVTSPCAGVFINNYCAPRDPPAASGYHVPVVRIGSGESVRFPHTISDELV